MDDLTSRANIYIMKVLEFLFLTTLANSVLSMSCTQLVVGNTLALIYDLQVSFSNCSANPTSVLSRTRKDISRIISILVSASKKVFLKN